LFGVLKQADPALVDPGVTAQLECLLDDVVVGKQEMVGAIDAVCDVAERIISKLKEGATAGGPFLLGSAGGNGTATYPPTPAMKRFADSLVRQKRIKPPPGYMTSISICRKFLSEHAPKKADGETAGKLDPKSVSPAQLLYAKKLAQGKGLVIPDDARTNSAAIKRRKSGRKTTYSQQNTPRLNWRRHRSGLENKKLTPMPLRWLPRHQTQSGRHCGFLMVTKSSL
jgi:DNA topoisomerase-3